MKSHVNYYNYYTEIEDTFIRRRGKNLFLSPLDWALIEAWQDRGIPLHIVIRSIESVFDVFDKQPPGTRTIKSLFYCKEEIEVQYTEWLTSRTGNSLEGDESLPEPKFPVDAVAEHIQDSIKELRANSFEWLQEDIERAAIRLEELLINLSDNPEKVDSTLEDIEKLLERAMRSNWDSLHLRTIEKEVAGQLRAYKSDMSPEAYESTFNLMLTKRLREEAGIPRLGLFYL